MSYLLDTNILSETVSVKPNKSVIKWLDSLPGESLHVSVLTIGEIWYGVERLDDGKKKTRLMSWVEHELPGWFEERVLSIDAEVAERWGYIRGRMKRPLSAVDGLIAATALTHNLKVVTRNGKDFEVPGLEVINPFK